MEHNRRMSKKCGGKLQRNAVQVAYDALRAIHIHQNINPAVLENISRACNGLAVAFDNEITDDFPQETR